MPTPTPITYPLLHPEKKPYDPSTSAYWPHYTEHTRGAPYLLMTQGKIERYHHSIKNIVKLQNYYSPWELEREIASFVEFYNHQRYHGSLDNLTAADVYFGRKKEVLNKRDEIKIQTLRQRRLHNLQVQVSV